MNGLLPMHPVIRLLFAFSLLLAGPALADPAPGSWEQALRQARGQTVYFNAWGGSGQINAYVPWAAEQVKSAYGITMKQVKLSTTAEAVARVVAETTAGRDDGGSVDLIWIN